MNTEKQPFEVLNLIVLALTVYVLGALIFDTFFNLPEEISKLLNYFDFLICIFFFFEFSVRFVKAENKWKFMKWGWVDLVASIPAVDILRLGRILRLIRILRVYKAFKSSKAFLESFSTNKVKGTFTAVLIIAFLLIIFSAISILIVENDPQSNIHTAEDAIWWAFVTISTVGYGDLYPVTMEGRIIAIVLICVGVAVFGTVTAFIASWFVTSEESK
jgi:voltage-gated potassium channel